MNVQAINSAMQISNCQPIRSQSFAKFVPFSNKNDNENSDVFTPSDPCTQEQKLDLACRLAAYYKTQYENLQNKTACCYA